jgi:hypothetical protein
LRRNLEAEYGLLLCMAEDVFRAAAEGFGVYEDGLMVALGEDVGQGPACLQEGAW